MPRTIRAGAAFTNVFGESPPVSWLGGNTITADILAPSRFPSPSSNILAAHVGQLETSIAGCGLVA